VSIRSFLSCFHLVARVCARGVCAFGNQQIFNRSKVVEAALEFSLTHAHSSRTAMLRASRSKCATEKVHSLCNRFSIVSQLLGGDSPYPVHRGKGDLSAASLGLCITIRCGGLRFPFRVKPKLDALLAKRSRRRTVTAPKRPFAIPNQEIDRASATHLLTTTYYSKPQR
jgi:hypothetical protein